MPGEGVHRVLSQEEVNALLSAVARGEIPGASAAEADAPSKPVVPYNFRKPNRVSKDQAKMLSSIHESFARLCTASLSTLLRALVEIELRGVEQVTYAEFIASITPPACLVVFNMEPLRGGATLQIDARVLFRLIDRLLGGSGLLPVRLREFTEVERMLIERVAVRLMLDLQQAWQHIGTFGFRVAQLETNPQFVQLTAPSEVVIVTTFDIRVGDVAGQMTLAFPHLLIEPVMSKLDTRRYLGVAPRAAAAEEGGALQENLLRLGLTVRGILAEVPLTVRELLELKAGAIVPLGVHATAPAVVEVEGVPRFTARPGTASRRKALRLLGVIPKGEVIRDTDDRSRRARIYAP
jgi:flagellar motor switch protein FliM